MMMYYYRRRRSPLKWFIAIIILLALVAFGYWFYVNYFSKIQVNEPVNETVEPDEYVSPQILQAKVTMMEGLVSFDLANSGYQKADQEKILAQNDKLKTGEQSQAVLTLNDGSQLRLGSNSELILTNLEKDKLAVELLNGRLYVALAADSQLQVKSLQSLTKNIGGKFEVIANSGNLSLAILAFTDNVTVEISDATGLLAANRLDQNEKAMINLKAAKKDLIKVEIIDPKVLIKEAWYKWNFDLDKGVTEPIPAEDEPDFIALTDSLQLTVKEDKGTGILSWSVYNQENFKAYKIVRSLTNKDLQYPADEVIKSSTNKDLSTYTDKLVEPGKNYYYRVCVEKDNEKVACGNIINLAIPEKEEVVEEDKTPPASAGLSAGISAEGVTLSWTKNTEDDFKEYKILRSQVNVLPVYPTELLAIKFKEVTSYLDREVNITSVGRYYYRVCSTDLNANYSCSNVKIIEDGQVK